MRTIIFGLLLIVAGTASIANAGRPGGGADTPSYPGTNLGALPGDRQSDAWGVNSAGHVVGRSYDSGRQAPMLMKAFYWDGTMRQLHPATEASSGESPWQSEAWAISNGPAETVVGLEDRMVCITNPADETQKICNYEQYPLVWEDAGTSSIAVRLDATRGRAFAINDAGDLAAGSCGGGVGAIWSRSDVGWSRVNIQTAAFPAADLVPSFPDGHDLTGHEIEIIGSAYDVNADAVVVGSMTWVDRTAEDACQQSNVRPCAEDVAYSRAYVYFARSAAGVSAGTGRVLPPPTGHGDNSAYAVSNLDSSGTVFYAAGATRVNPDDNRGKGIRWTISLDGAGGQAVLSEVLEQHAWSQGVNEKGHVAGTTNSKIDRRGNVIQTATLFQQSVGYIALRPPKGGSDSTSRAMAGVGPIYVVGEANVKGAWRAALWTVP